MQMQMQIQMQMQMMMQMMGEGLVPNGRDPDGAVLAGLDDDTGP
jgi:hypothetical protein